MQICRWDSTDCRNSDKHHNAYIENETPHAAVFCFLLRAVLVMLVSFVLSLIIRIKFNYRTRGQRRVEKAKALGHVVNGTVISATFDTDENGNRKYSGRVGYEVDGCKYSTIIVPSGSSIISKGDTEPVYWIDNPKRGFVSCNSESFLGVIEWLLVVSIPAVLAFLTLLVTGGLQK